MPRTDDTLSMILIFLSSLVKDFKARKAMATGYTPTKETTNFAKFSWIMVDVCRDVLFDIVSLEIAPIDIPNKIKATPQKVKLFPEQRKSICNKPGGAAPNNEDFDIPSLYTILRNLCCIQPPTKGWFDNTLQNHPLPTDVRVSDDVERLRNKRNALFGHTKRAKISDSDFQKELSEIKDILTRLDKHLGTHYGSVVTSIEHCSMDPEMEQVYILLVEEQGKKDTETRALLETEQKKISEIEEKVQKLTVSHGQERTLLEQTRKDMAEAKQAMVEMAEKQKLDNDLHQQTQEETKHALTLVKEDQTETEKVLKDIQEERKQEKSLHQQTLESVRELRDHSEESKKLSDEQWQFVKEKQETLADQLEEQKSKTEEAGEMLLTMKKQHAEMKSDIEAMKDGPLTLEELRQADEAKLQDYLHQLYEVDENMKVSVIPSSDDVPLSQVFTTIVIREDLEAVKQQDGERKLSIGHHRKGQGSQETGKSIDSYHDMFYRDGLLQRNVYLLGQAGSGKTTFCHHLVDVWCRSPNQSQFNNVEDIIKFEYVFLVSCRDAETSDTILDMILSQLFDSETEYLYQTVKHVLKTNPEKCLVLVDGLDEWAGSPSKSTGARSPCGLPNRKGLENCVMLTTSRPWRVEALRQGLGKLPRILEIQGLTDRNMEKLSENLFSALQVPLSSTFEVFMAAVKASEMTEIVKTPLMLVIVLTVWLAERKLDRSLCVNYARMIECLIQRAEGVTGRTNDTNRLADVAQLLELKSVWAKENRRLPLSFNNMAFCGRYAPLIYKIANFAFDALFHEIKEKALVFSREELETVFKITELEVCLAIGIFSLASVRVRSVKRMTKVSFLHKSVQEFLAALWMASTETQHWLPVFQSHCQSQTSVLDYSKVVLFLCGLNPDKGRELWCFIGKVIEADPLVIEYRQAVAEPFSSAMYGYADTKQVILLQQLAMQCLNEADQNLPVQFSKLRLFFPIRDLYVDGRLNDLVYEQALASPAEVRSLVIDHFELAPVSMKTLHRLVGLERLHIRLETRPSDQQFKSLWVAIRNIPSLRSLYMENCWPETDPDLLLEKRRTTPLSAFTSLFSKHSLKLPQLRKLTLIESSSISPNLHLILPLSLTTVYMDRVALSHPSIVSLTSLLGSGSCLQEVDIRLVQCGDCAGVCRFDVDLSRHSQLERVVLGDLYRYCGVQTVRVSPGMALLRRVGMHFIQMSPEAWQDFLLSLPRPEHRLTVDLRRVNIDTDSLRYIEGHFTVTRIDKTIANTTIAFHNGVTTV